MNCESWLVNFKYGVVIFIDISLFGLQTYCKASKGNTIVYMIKRSTMVKIDPLYILSGAPE